ncbi:MAG TPA: flagellar biosynthetic protein FliO [Zoogloea sp.]|uniref:flagellar biosynthetic protein FliO n=1 Tax=Zoogloea sp. TaxID=49181 RepID=UPI002C33E2DD|nr:flagellar biosynthetic protein FliO [Zoogloea sp.]HMV61924.1 flagellar biosynthetic protein FliO [Rhodocyclaceae bacterium]HMW50670.1 flagellar biosynthetic protein FliO [Rhodocyclaceae bacterium]HMY49326.1 flagellar biosynthetic protein FliO [Rhodocyclaceae bacterium]HMZ74736.1 flagellar biosynthetic protein FliO [Rhodocyclaceae bacterium]HNA66932.1 flagellar biosynthetic protein FliO [Rhodocyclaceae bacterium]
MRRALVPAVLLSIGPVALAGDAAPDLTGSVVQTLLALGAVIGLLFGTLHLLRRSGVARAGGAGLLQVRAATAVGPRERVVLVEVAGKLLVLGVAPGRVTPLHTLDATDLPAVPSRPAGERDFQSWLRQTLERRAP